MTPLHTTIPRSGIHGSKQNNIKRNATMHKPTTTKDTPSGKSSYKNLSNVKSNNAKATDKLDNVKVKDNNNNKKVQVNDDNTMIKHVKATHNTTKDKC